ncbi:MAG: hypothetical protein ACQETG_05685 [Thermodesulfobacteriota bacterium]
MEEQEGPRGFKIDFNAEEQETPEKEPAAAEKQPEKKAAPGRRAAGLVFAWIGLLIVLGGLFFLGYRQLHSRILELESMNENELQMISGEVNERLTGISELMKEQTQQNRELIREIENKSEENSGEIQDIKNALAVIRNNLSDLENSFTDSLGSLEERTKDTESITDSQQEEIDELASSVDKLQGLESDINEAGRAMQEAQSRVDSLENRVAEMQDNLMDPESLEEKGDEISRSLDRKLESETGGMRERLNDLEDQVQGLEAMINALEDMQKQNGRSSDGSGEIIEQELD